MADSALVICGAAAPPRGFSRMDFERFLSADFFRIRPPHAARNRWFDMSRVGVSCMGISGPVAAAHVVEVIEVSKGGQTAVSPQSQFVQPPQYSVSPSEPDANLMEPFPLFLQAILRELANCVIYLHALLQPNQFLQSMLQELHKQNPNIMTSILEDQVYFFYVLNEPADGTEGNCSGPLPAEIPTRINGDPEETEAKEQN